MTAPHAGTPTRSNGLATADVFVGPLSRWTVLYFPLPVIAVIGCLLGMAGVYRQRRMAATLPFFMAAWIVIAMIFVGWVPDVV